MQLFIFTVYDSKLEAYLPPFFSQTRGIAIRDFTTAANDADHAFHRFGGDYSLFELGVFDQVKGVFSQHSAAINLGTALSHIQHQVIPLTSDHPNLDQKEAV